MVLRVQVDVQKHRTVAALLTKESGITLGALVDDGRPWNAAGKAERELVGRSLSETEATLAASV